MSDERIACAGMIVATLAFAVSCNRHATESRVKSLEARIDGITCPTCVPPLTASLKRQYKNSEIVVDDDKDTATVRFAESENFSAPEFQAAVERVLKMRVVTLRLQVCGTVEASHGEKWLAAGTNRFRLKSDRDVPVDEPICADGTLDNRVTPLVFEISAFSAQNAPGS
jgi:hypothetical protein